MVISSNMYDMICIHNLTYVLVIYKTFAMAALVLMTRIFHFILIKPICPMIPKRMTVLFSYSISSNKVQMNILAYRSKMVMNAA